MKLASPLLCALGLALAMILTTASSGQETLQNPPAQQASGPQAGGASAQAAPPATQSAAPAAAAPLPYDREYPFIPYAGEATHNQVAQLMQRLAHGQAQLPWKAPRGYLDGLLKALGIDPSSQTLVYSRTSLQSEFIEAATPRAIYFNDDSYVSWIPGSPLLEIGTMDSVLGQVFYTVDNSPGNGKLVRQNGACLECHDTFALLGGGVPRFIFLSTLVNTHGDTLTGGPGVETNDETPIAERWGGWYVTGHEGHQQHRGNVLAHNAAELADPLKSHHRNLLNLDGVVDTHAYLRNTSDIVALLILEHQVYVKDLITRVSYKSGSVLMRQLGEIPQAHSWAELPPNAQKLVRPLTEALVRALLFVHAAPIDGPISGSSGFDAWFQRQGPRDSHGRSLRQLDLQTRLFRYPLSYVIYSEAFDGMPDFARDYVYRRIADVLTGREKGTEFEHLDAQQRKDILEILLATKPAFARVAGS